MSEPVSDPGSTDGNAASVVAESNITLANIANGAAVELFAREFQRALENIDDPNTKAKAKRTITVKVILTPDEARDRIDAAVAVESKFPSVKPGTVKPGTSTMYLGRRGGKVHATEVNPKQPSLFDPPGNVKPLRPN